MTAESVLNEILSRVQAFSDGLWEAMASLESFGVSPAHARLAREAWSLFAFTTPVREPIIQITSEGDVQFAWNRGRYYLDLDIHPDGKVAWFFRDREADDVDGTEDYEKGLSEKFWSRFNLAGVNIEKAHVPVSPPQAPPRRPFALGPSESFPVKLDKRSTNPKKGEILFFDFLNQNNKRVQIFVKKPNAASIFFETLRRKLKIGVAFHELMEAYFGLFCRTYPNHGLDTRGMFNRSWERYLISNDLVHKKSTLQKGALVEFIDPNFAEELKKFNFLKTIKKKPVRFHHGVLRAFCVWGI